MKRIVRQPLYQLLDHSIALALYKRDQLIQMPQTVFIQQRAAELQEQANDAMADALEEGDMHDC